MLASFLSGEFLLHIPCWLHFYLGSFSQLHIPCWLYFNAGSFSYTSHVDFVFKLEVSLTHPLLPSFLYGEFLLHTPCCLHFYAGSFSYTSHPSLLFFFFLYIYILFTNKQTKNLWGVSLKHLVQVCFLSGEYLLHIPCWLQFYLGSFSYTSRAGFNQPTFSYTSRAVLISMQGASLKHPMLASISSSSSS